MAIPLREATNRRGLHHAAKHRDEDDADACVAYTPKTLPRPFHARGETPSTAKIVRSGKENADEERDELLAGAKAGDRLGFESKALLRPIGESEAAPWLTVVLDLDETLVNNRRLDLPSAILRPYVREALAALRQLPGVEVVLWTASTEDTAAPVVRQLSAAGKVFDDVIFRNDQWFTEPYHSKDLALLGRPMDRVIIFDNAPNCCKINRFNSVLVEDFTGYCNPADNTLINLYRIVEVLVREIKQGSSVPETLGVLADEEAICRRVAFELPEAWRRVNVAEMHPLRVPPHGDFFKVQITTF